MVLADGAGTGFEEAATLLALVEAADRLHGVRRRHVAELVEHRGSTGALLERGSVRGRPAQGSAGRRLADDEPLERLMAAVTPEQVAAWQRRLARLSEEHPDVSLVTIANPMFPPGLRPTPSTPFLFVRGQLPLVGARAAAFAGTRRPSQEGIEATRELAGVLVTAGITVVSGLAEGIDTAAHGGTLAAGGWTVAVLGHGLLAPVYPPSNAALAREIVHAGGAVVSQFWPWTGPNRQTFARRNATSSALALGTVVIEAGERSGARLQADLCLRQGRTLFLPERLVATREWARRYAGRSGVYVFRDGKDVVDHLGHPGRHGRDAHHDNDGTGTSLKPRPVQLRFGDEAPW
ncbi:MAG: DNA-processing protein DprA [Actinomycetota bacterium]|jgi:DNA processing protein|nr:DNA-processing protein DprA [Actinomycetota bacterium]